MRTAFSWQHAVIKSDLAPGVRHVLLTLACYMNPAGGSCFPSIERLASATGLSKRSVISHINAACEAGFLIRRKHGFQGQRWNHNEYEAAWPGDTTAAAEPVDNPGNEVQTTHEGGAIIAPKQVQRLHTTLPRYQTNNNPPTPQEGGSAVFEELWKAWPRKSGTSKKQAMTAFLRLPMSDRGQCLEYGRLYASEQAGIIAKDRARETYCCHLATFINQRRFETMAEIQEEKDRQLAAARAEYERRVAADRVRQSGVTLTDAEREENRKRLSRILEKAKGNLR